MNVYAIYDDEAGLIDIVDNEAAAKEFTKKYLGFFYEEITVHHNVDFDRTVYKYDVYTESTYKDGKVEKGITPSKYDMLDGTFTYDKVTVKQYTKLHK